MAFERPRCSLDCQLFAAFLPVSNFCWTSWSHRTWSFGRFAWTKHPHTRGTRLERTSKRFWFHCWDKVKCQRLQVIQCNNLPTCNVLVLPRWSRGRGCFRGPSGEGGRNIWPNCPGHIGPFGLRSEWQRKRPRGLQLISTLISFFRRWEQVVSLLGERVAVRCGARCRLTIWWASLWVLLYEKVNDSRASPSSRVKVNFVLHHSTPHTVSQTGVQVKRDTSGPVTVVGMW